jgi:starch phosphorylase
MRNTDPKEYICPELWKVIDAIREGMFGHNDDLNHLVDTITNRNDYYLVGHDFLDYCAA